MDTVEVKKVSVEEKGAAVDMRSGDAKIPDGSSVRNETLNQSKYVLDDTPRNRELLAKLLAKNGFPREAAELRGKPYEEGFVVSAKNLVAENASVIKGLAVVAIGAFTYYVSKKALNLLAKKMGWNLFGNEVIPTATIDGSSTTPSSDAPFRTSTRRATMPSATA